MTAYTAHLNFNILTFENYISFFQICHAKPDNDQPNNSMLLVSNACACVHVIFNYIMTFNKRGWTSQQHSIRRGDS